MGEGHPGALRAHQVARRDPDALERDDRVVVTDRVRVRRGAHDADPGTRQVDEEHRVLAVVVATHEPGLEEGVGRLVVRRDVPLLAVQDVVVAVPPRGGRQVGDVGPGVLLRDGVALDGVAADRRQQPSFPLVRRRHRRQPSRGSGHAPGERVRDPAALLLDQHLLQGAQPAPAVLDRDVRRREAQVAGPRPVGRLDVGRQPAVVQLGLDLERDQLVGERPGSGLDLEVGLGQTVHGASRRQPLD